MTLDLSSRSRTCNPLFKKPVGAFRRARSLGDNSESFGPKGHLPLALPHIDLRLATGTLSGETEWLTASIC